MEQRITGHFDGMVIIPDKPVALPMGETLQIRIEVTSAATLPLADLVELAVDDPDWPPDFSLQHDHYLYGTPKK